jgi:hypothetical protein
MRNSFTPVKTRQEGQDIILTPPNSLWKFRTPNDRVQGKAKLETNLAPNSRLFPYTGFIPFIG